MTERDELLAAVERAAVELAARLSEALEGGVGPAVLLPTLAKVFDESGLAAGIPR